MTSPSPPTATDHNKEHHGALTTKSLLPQPRRPRQDRSKRCTEDLSVAMQAYNAAMAEWQRTVPTDAEKAIIKRLQAANRSASARRRKRDAASASLVACSHGSDASSRVSPDEPMLSDLCNLLAEATISFAAKAGNREPPSPYFVSRK